MEFLGTTAFSYSGLVSAVQHLSTDQQLQLLQSHTGRLSGFNPLPTIGNSLKKQKSLYKVQYYCLVSNPHMNSYGHMGAHDALLYASLVGKGLKDHVLEALEGL